jgi:thiamine biosynthesis protein ThiI
VPRDFEGMAEAIVARLPPKESAQTFRVLVRRADQKFPVPSPDLARDLGSRVWTARGWKVDLDHADLVVRVEIIPGGAYCAIGREQGTGGLPMGTGGRLVALLSGGIDSPVAAWRMMAGLQRDVRALSQHAVPLRRLAGEGAPPRRGLTRYQLRSKLYLVPFGELQRQITMSVQGDLRVIVYRRMMLRCAAHCRHVRAKALVTGDVIPGHSQTLDNMTTIDRASHLTIFRPGGTDRKRSSPPPRSSVPSIFRSPGPGLRAPCLRRGTRDPCPALRSIRPAHPGRHHGGRAVGNAVVEQLQYPVIK